MPKETSLHELIEHHLTLGRQSSSGWKSLRCQVCNDHSERAAFKSDGIYTGLNCFNCNAKFKYEEGSGKLSKDARKILECFGITNEMLNTVVSSSFFNKQEEKEITLIPPVNLYTPVIELPPKSYLLGSDIKQEFQEPLISYLNKRQLDITILNPYFSLDPKYLNRVIIPCTRDNKIIFWQARSILNDVKPRYMSPSVNKEAVLWGYDELWKNHDKPLFITEGIFNASQINGIALLGATLNEAKLEILNRCKRRKIVVIDRDNKGAALANLALKNKWEITFPTDDKSDPLDVNDSIIKYGKLKTIWELMKNTTSAVGIKDVDGVMFKSKLELAMQMANSKLRTNK
jgi:hypothetical protein